MPFERNVPESWLLILLHHHHRLTFYQFPSASPLNHQEWWALCLLALGSLQLGRANDLVVEGLPKSLHSAVSEDLGACERLLGL